MSTLKNNYNYTHRELCESFMYIYLYKHIELCERFIFISNKFGKVQKKTYFYHWDISNLSKIL